MKQKKTVSKFEKLFQEAMEDDNLFNDFGDESADDVVDTYDSEISDIDGEGDEVGGGVTVTLSTDQVAVLKDILAQVEGDGEGEGEGDEVMGDGFEGEEGGDDIEDLEEEAVEMENAPSVEQSKKLGAKGGGNVKTAKGDLPKETEKKMGEEEQYKFVKRQVPQELKHKTTKGS